MRGPCLCRQFRRNRSPHSDCRPPITRSRHFRGESAAVGSSYLGITAVTYRTTLGHSSRAPVAANSGQRRPFAPRLARFLSSLTLLGSLLAGCIDEPWPGLSTYPAPTGPVSLGGRFEGTLELRGSCVGLNTDQGFMPLVVPTGQYSFDGKRLVGLDRTITLGQRAAFGGGILELSSLTGRLSLGKDCHGFLKSLLVGSQ